MPGEDGGKLHLRVHHKVNYKQILYQTCCFAHILVQGIAIEHAVSDGGIRAQLRRIKGERMIMEYRLAAADARQYALAPAAEARHHVVRHRTETDHDICFCRRAVDGHGRAVRRRAEVYKVGGIAVMVFNMDTVVYRIGHESAQLLLAAALVRPVCDDYADARFPHSAALSEIVHQMRDDKILPHPEARHIADYERDGISGLDALIQRFAPNRLIERVPQRCPDVLYRLHLAAVQLAEDIAALQRKSYRTVTVSKLIIIHVYPTHTAYSQLK